MDLRGYTELLVQNPGKNIKASLWEAIKSETYYIYNSDPIAAITKGSEIVM